MIQNTACSIPARLVLYTSRSETHGIVTVTTVWTVGRTTEVADPHKIVLKTLSLGTTAANPHTGEDSFGALPLSGLVTSSLARLWPWPPAFGSARSAVAAPLSLHCWFRCVAAMAYEFAREDMQQHCGHAVRGDRVVPIVNLAALGVGDDLTAPVTGMQWAEYTRLRVQPGTEVCVQLQDRQGTVSSLSRSRCTCFYWLRRGPGGTAPRGAIATVTLNFAWPACLTMVSLTKRPCRSIMLVTVCLSLISKTTMQLLP